MRMTVLKSVNLGDDTDTVAAITGGLAGALYGYDAIPEKWCNTLIKSNKDDLVLAISKYLEKSSKFDTILD